MLAPLPPLVALAFVLAACAAPDGPAPGSAVGSSAGTPGAPGAATPTVTTDSLVVTDAATGLDIRIGYPVVAGAAAADAVNEQIARTVAEIALEYEEMEPPPEGAMWTVAVDGGYELTLLTDGVVSFNQHAWAYAGGAHGNSFFYPQSYALDTGRPLALDDVVRATPAGLAALAEAAREGIVRAYRVRMEGSIEEAREAAWLDDVTATREAFEGVWSVAPDSLVLHYAPYAVGPYAAGSFRVPVPFSELGGHLGPVAAALAER